MQDDATPTDTKPSQKRLKRGTPEDADTAQEPERRVRPRETPVGAGAAPTPWRAMSLRSCAPVMASRALSAGGGVGDRCRFRGRGD